eukprot:354460-Chlamydomonas_euryale.AAC.6
MRFSFQRGMIWHLFVVRMATIHLARRACRCRPDGEVKKETQDTWILKEPAAASKYNTLAAASGMTATVHPAAYCGHSIRTESQPSF